MARRPETARHHPDSPLVINISRLGRRPGSVFEVHNQVPSPSRIGLDLVAIERDSILELDLRVESVSEGVLVTGTVGAPTVGQCVRCLTPVAGSIEVRLTELFAYPNSVTDETTEEGEVCRVVADTVDVEQPLIDAVGLELPLSPLCAPDCPGLCPRCGVPLATAEPGHQHEAIDPRWAKLAALLPTEEPGG